MMSLANYIWFTFAVFATLAIFSFLYKDNPFYKFAEHLVVGVSAGYFVIILWHNSLVPNLFQRLADGDWYFLWLNSSAPWYLIPALLGVMMWTRFSKQYSWVSRWPMALYIGISTGIAIPLEMKNRVNEQLLATMVSIDWGNFFGNHDQVRALTEAGGDYARLRMAQTFLMTSPGNIPMLYQGDDIGTYGGIDRATWNFWRSKVQDSTDTTTLLADMNLLWSQLVRGADRPDLIMMDGEVWQAYVAALQAQQRFTQPNTGEFGFPSIKFSNQTDSGFTWIVRGCGVNRTTYAGKSRT